MPRIIAGTAAGRRLRVAGEVSRPTTDRVREAVFSALQHRLGGWHGQHVLDLFAGSGALGLEAASRGAQDVLLVEKDRRAAAVIAQNIEAAGLDNANVRRADVWRLGRRGAAVPPEAAADVLFVDPPYRIPSTRIAGLLEQLVADQWCAPGCLVVLERSARDADWQWPLGWQERTDRRYGETRILLGALVASA